MVQDMGMTNKQFQGFLIIKKETLIRSLSRFPFSHCGRRDLNPHVVANTRSLV